MTDGPKLSRTRGITRAGLIAAVYAAATLPLLQTPLGYGPIQFRVSEALTVLAVLTPAAIPGLWLGTLIANGYMLTQAGAIGLFDVVLGSTATLLAALWTWRFRRHTLLALAGPVVTNALIVPAYLPILLKVFGGLDQFYTIPGTGVSLAGTYVGMYLFGVATVGIGQALVVYGLGWPLLMAARRVGLADTIAGRP